ncbi:hypothetical protein TcYC6_0075360 [Trypanosoma cruzi]|nr:hypothetical protein TcYC6_0075360 [Trypanosoma cruzi]
MSFLFPFQPSADLERVAENVGGDAAVLAALLFNTSTLGTYRIQEHSIHRVKDAIEQGKGIGQLNSEKYRLLLQDVKLAAQQLHETVEEGRHALQRMHLCVGRLLVGMPGTERKQFLGTPREMYSPPFP